MKEYWEVCEEFPNIAISNMGRIEDLDRGRFVPTRANHQGFIMTTINDGTRQYTRSVAILVARTFIEPSKLNHFTSVIHLNGDRSDCRALNLMWRSRPFALRYHAMFNDEPYRVRVRILETGEFYQSLREVCTTYGLIESIAYRDMRMGVSTFPSSFTIQEIQD